MNITTAEFQADVGLDFDDVVVNTLGVVKRKTKETARMLGLEIPSDEQISDVYNYSSEMAQKLFQGHEEDFLRIYHSLDFPYASVDGAREAIELLAASGARIWIFTGSMSARDVEARALQADIDPSHFYRIVDGNATHPYKKPHKAAWDIYARELQRAGVDAGRKLFVEDSLENYHRAIEIGLQAVLLLGSPNSSGHETSVPNHNTLSSMHELPSLVRSRGFIRY